MRLDVDEATAFLTCGENHYAVDEGEERVILAHANVESGMVLGAALTLEDISGFAVGAAEYLDAQSFAF